MQQPPQLTFSSDQCKEAAAMLTWVHQNARWGDGPVNSQFAQDIGKFFNWCHKHINMMNSHIMQLEQFIPSEEGDAERAKEAKEAKKAK